MRKMRGNGPSRKPAVGMPGSRNTWPLRTSTRAKMAAIITIRPLGESHIAEEGR
jgi:hypothetical protein